MIAELLQAGPEKAAPILKAIMEDQTGNLTRMLNEASGSVRSVQEKMVETARVTQRAINATGTDMAAEFGTAMDILAAKAALGGKATADAIADKLGIGVDRVRQIAKDYIIVLVEGINPLLSAIGSVTIKAEGGVPAGVYVGNMALGGPVPGQGDTDSVPAMLMPGEYVVSKPAVQRIGMENIDAWHKKARRGYAAGGFVYPTDVPPTPDFSAYGTGLGYSGDQSMKMLHDEVAKFLAAHPPQKTGGSGSGGGYGFQALIDFLNAKGVENEVTSTQRDGATTVNGTQSLHALGQAADFWSSNMREIFDAFEMITPSLQELFYDPVGHSVKNGQYADWIAGGHDDHVHAATWSGPGAGPGVPGTRGGDGASAPVTGGIWDWIDAAMSLTDAPGSWRDPLYRRAMYESGGQNIPQGITDINSENGTPAFGPFQVIQPTFDAYAVPGHKDWHNPVDSSAAAIKYIEDQYGSIFEIDPPTSGYSLGGLVKALSAMPMMHAGGVVPGSPGSDVLALLQGGEGVLSRSTMAKSTPLVAQLNNTISSPLGTAWSGRDSSPVFLIAEVRSAVDAALAHVESNVTLKLDRDILVREVTKGQWTRRKARR